MTAPSPRPRRIRLARLMLPVVLATAAGCSRGQEVTPESVQAARALWQRAGVRDYDLDWSVNGRNNARYRVTVRDGEVRKIESVQPDGKTVALRSAEANMFGVDGLFRTMDGELAVCSKAERPFDQPKGTKVVMRFKPDAKLGYPHWYHRDVLGTPASVAIDVNALTPVPASAR